eukprot:EG_transcript_9698
MLVAQRTLKASLDCLEIHMATMAELAREAPNKCEPKEWEKVVQEMQTVGNTLMLMGQTSQRTAAELGAQLLLAEGTEEEALAMEAEITKMLRDISKAVKGFIDFPVANWQIGAARLQSFYERHKTLIVTGGVVGALCGGAAGWMLVRHLLSSCTSMACVVNAAAEAFATEVAFMALGALGGAALTALLIWGIVKLIDRYTKSPEQRNLEALKHRLECLKKTPLPSLADMRELRLRVVGVITDIFDAEGLECYVCHEVMTNCTNHAKGTHLPTCATFPFRCRHPVCHQCGPQVQCCGLCRASIR